MAYIGMNYCIVFFYYVPDRLASLVELKVDTKLSNPIGFIIRSLFLTTCRISDFVIVTKRRTRRKSLIFLTGEK